MSVGKYSPNCPHANSNYEFKYNCYKQIPPEYKAGVDVYDDKIHGSDYDSEGFDRYGYSAFDEDGNFVGHGQGVDREGMTEDDYLREFCESLARQCGDDYEEDVDSDE